MKKTRILFIFTLLILSLSAFIGCSLLSAGNENPFSVFEKDFTAELDIALNGSDHSLIYEKQKEVKKTTLTSPSSVSGYVFLKNANKTTVSYGDLNTEATEKTSFLPNLLDTLFSAKITDVTEIKTEKTDSGTFTVVKTPCASFRFDKSGCPAEIEGAVNGIHVKITLKSFSQIASDGEQTSQ
jgi:hypothetical protein